MDRYEPSDLNISENPVVYSQQNLHQRIGEGNRSTGRLSFVAKVYKIAGDWSQKLIGLLYLGTHFVFFSVALLLFLESVDKLPFRAMSYGRRDKAQGNVLASQFGKHI